MKLTRDERSRLLKGNYSAIKRVSEPECEVGDLTVLSRSRPRRHADPETGHVFAPPSEPLLMIQVTAKLRNKAGEWVVRFDVRDRRNPQRLIRRKPPAVRYGEEEIEQDEDVVRIESAYTSDVSAAVDHLAAVDDDDLDRFTKRARAREAQDATDVIVAAEEVMKALKERCDNSPAFRREGRLAVHRMRRELDRLIERQRKKAA